MTFRSKVPKQEEGGSAGPLARKGQCLGLQPLGGVLFSFFGLGVFGLAHLGMIERNRH